MSNSLDPDQTRCFVGPDLGPNCLQRLSADNTRRQSVKLLHSGGPMALGEGQAKMAVKDLNCLVDVHKQK